MTEKQKARIRKLGLKEADFAPKPKVNTEEISREEFNLLDMQDDNTIYYIHEDDGTITIVKGEN